MRRLLLHGVPRAASVTPLASTGPGRLPRLQPGRSARLADSSAHTGRDVVSGDELVIFPPSSVAGLAAIVYRVVPDESAEDDERDDA